MRKFIGRLAIEIPPALPLCHSTLMIPLPHLGSRSLGFLIHLPSMTTLHQLVIASVCLKRISPGPGSTILCSFGILCTLLPTANGSAFSCLNSRDLLGGL